MFYAGPNFLSRSKILIAYSASSKTFVLAQKPNGNNLLVCHKMFGTATKCTYIDFWSGLKRFGPAKNTLGPVDCRRTRHKTMIEKTRYYAPP